jgi:hypothetical protein
MNYRARVLVLAPLLVAIVSALGFYVPRVGEKLASLYSQSPGLELPLLTRCVLAAAPVGFITFGLTIASMLLASAIWKSGHWLKHVAFVFVGIFALLVAVGLYLPIRLLTHG